jgi:glutamate N-acetyltransferase/amino-acid N-acetyltransferase
VALSQGVALVTGIAKGSGMIHPNMATMLGYVLTDAALTPSEAETMLRDAVDASFNMISVDGDSSTNDSVFLLANGASGAAPATERDRAAMADAIREICTALAKSIARDGEGATKLMEVRVSGAATLAEARAAARAVTVSPLVKTAVHGADPNWGRVVAAVGKSGTSAAARDRIGMTLQGRPVLRGGAPVAFDREALRAALRTETVVIAVDLGVGAFAATAWGCDLSQKYVEINTDYTT